MGRPRPPPLSPQAAAIATTFLLLLLAIAIFRFFRPRRAGPRLPPNVKRFRYRDLEIATDSFDASHKLGQGGLGIVFKGVLKNGQAVAIKRLEDSEPPSSRGEMELQNELLMMSHVNNSCPHIVSLLGFSSHRKHKLLVYEYMENKSVQEALFDENYPYKLTWEQRFQILLEASRALGFLHECKPCPIIHGDVKPSNVLLDGRFGARLADFGLARFKTHLMRSGIGADEEPCGTRGLEHGAIRHKHIIVKEKLEKVMSMPRKLDEVSPTPCPGLQLDNASSIAAFTTSPESDGSSFTTAMQASEVPSTAESFVDDVRLDVNSLMDDDAHVDATNSLREGSVPGAPEPHPSSSVREYVMEWMGHKHKVLIATKDCDAASEASTNTSATTMSTAKDSGEPRKRSRSSEWWGHVLPDDRDCVIAPVEKTEEGFRGEPEDACSIVVQPAHETKKKDCGVKSRRWNASFEWCRSDETRECGEKFETGENAKPRSREWWKDDELAMGGKEWKSRNKKMESSLSCCSDGWSGELGASKGVHTTPSMRGTICYVAPENGSGVVLSEKSDVYSFGVLMLVVVSGRRPLQVMDSPLVEFERANLVSWSKHLAHSGNVLDLVDTSLKGAFDKPQATLCITIALLCLQRLPSMRPSMNEVLKMLLGEMQCPSLPSQLSLSHRCRRARKPR